LKIRLLLIDVQTGKVVKTATEDCECNLKDVLTNSIKNVARTIAGLEITDNTSNIKSYKPLEQKTANIENHPEYKSPTTAFMLSFIIPGVGQYYNGDIGLGLIHNITFAAGILAFAGGTYNVYSHESGERIGEEKYFWYYLGIGGAIGTWVWSWLDARSSAIDNNTKLNQQYGHLFELDYSNKIVGFDLDMKMNSINGQVTIHF